MIWYTADLHLGHANIIGLCHRPFRSVDEMDEALVATLASLIGSEDDLYVVGDFAHWHKRNAGHAASLLAAIPGRKHLVVGNHDAAWVRELPWTSVHDLVEVKDEGERVVLCHYPLITWNGARRGSMHLFGHVHGNWRGSRNAVNVGVDVWDYRPVTLKEARLKAATLPVNRHWKDVEPGLGGWEVDGDQLGGT